MMSKKIMRENTDVTGPSTNDSRMAQEGELAMSARTNPPQIAPIPPQPTRHPITDAPLTDPGKWLRKKTQHNSHTHA